MKRNFFIGKMIAWMAMAAVCINNVAAEAGIRFAQNTEISDGQIITKTIYMYGNEGYLSNHIHYEYTYDSEGRTTSKLMYKWDATDNKWQKARLYTFTYEGSTCTIDMQLFDKNNRDTPVNAEKYIYATSNDGSLLLSRSYKWDSHERTWNLATDVSAEKLLASKN